MGAQQTLSGQQWTTRTYAYPRLHPERATKETLKWESLFEQDRHMCRVGRAAKATDDGVSTTAITVPKHPTLEVAHKPGSQTRLKRFFLHLALAQNASRRCSGLELLQVIRDRHFSTTHSMHTWKHAAAPASRQCGSMEAQLQQTGTRGIKDELLEDN